MGADADAGAGVAVGWTGSGVGVGVHEVQEGDVRTRRGVGDRRGSGRVRQRRREDARARTVGSATDEQKAWVRAMPIFLGKGM